MKLLNILTGFLNKFKAYLIGLVILILIAGFFTIKYLVKENQKYRSDNYRLESNQFQILSDVTQQTELYLKQKEVTGRIKRERDSLALIVKVKPKYITKVITETVTIKDTVFKEVSTTLISKGMWNISDSDKCFLWQAKAVLKNDSLLVNRTLFNYENKTTEIYWRERPHKFLFIKYGKFVNYQKKSSDCGSVQTKIFNFIK